MATEWNENDILWCVRVDSFKFVCSNESRHSDEQSGYDTLSFAMINR